MVPDRADQRRRCLDDRVLTPAPVLELRSQGQSVRDEVLSYIPPGPSDNVNFFGVINVGVEAELGKLDGGGRRRSGRPSYKTSASPIAPAGPGDHAAEAVRVR